jgi:hypothetical protein
MWINNLLQNFLQDFRKLIIKPNLLKKKRPGKHCFFVK